jgi:hypothetical protein
VTSRPYSILLYGGTDGIIDFNDLWRYDLSINQWTLITPTVNSSWPHARAQAATTSIPGSLLIFGGEMTYEGLLFLYSNMLNNLIMSSFEFSFNFKS